MFDQEYWFKKKNKKFLHNIDSFYFSVFLEDDFTETGDSPAVNRVRRCIDGYKKEVKDVCSFHEFRSDYVINYRKGVHARFFSFHLECPDRFDIFFAPYVPKNVDGECVTNQINVQLRASYLWEVGCKLAFDYAYKYVVQFCKHFGLTIIDIKENRTDFCWHTNALSNPEKFFTCDSFCDNVVTTLGRNKEGDFRFIPHFSVNSKTGVKDFDYLPMGKRSDKCFLRIYHKTKEVVQEGYKGWFFYIWFFNGLISRYDLYCLEEAYKVRQWRYTDVARLKFILEYMQDDIDAVTLSTIEQLLHPDGDQYDYATIHQIAGQYTPDITRIYNIEYQVMRRFTKSIQLYEFKENTGITKRIYDFLDNHAVITDYLTNNTFRIVDFDTARDKNKSRAPYCDFWRRLRGTKMVDAPSSHNLKLVRKYSRDLDLQVRKTRAVRAITSFALAVNQDNETNIFQDSVELLNQLNDNDVRSINQYKVQRSKQMQKPDAPPPDPERFRSFIMVDDDGVIV